MDVDMKRSTNTAPVSLSTAYLMGAPCIGISMTTVQSFGTSAPEGTRSKLMRDGSEWKAGSRRPNERRLYRAAAAITLMLAAAFVPLTPAYAADPPTAAELALFSHLPRGAVPEPWTPVSIVIGKRSTRYDLVDDAG